MKIYNTAQEAKEFCEASIRNQKSDVAVLNPKEVSLLADIEEDYDRDFVEANNIPTVVLQNEGGCIVAFPGNLEVGHFTTNLDLENQYGKRVTESVLSFLRERGLDVAPDNNDVLVDKKYKVFSWASRIYGSVLFTAVHISINCDAELVDKICNKPMTKIPKGLADYGITTEEMLAILVECLANEA